MPLVISTPAGLYCEAGDFHIDPWRPVSRAVITHGHGDHASWGHEHYLASRASEQVLRRRLPEAALQTIEYGEPLDINGVRVSLHPAGHVLGSAQVRLEHRGEVWVVSGDYKLQPDPTCAPFEPVRCDTFITESTFGLPIYRWRDPRDVFAEVDAWWRANQAVDRASVVYAYALGKAQRLLSSVDASIGPIYTHGAVEALNEAYRASGVALPPTQRVAELPKGHDYSRALIVAPPSAQGTPWMRRFGDLADGFASGWMQIRGVRRRKAVDRGFALSDHADWPSLLSAIAATGAQHVYVTHGYSDPLVRWLCEHGLDAQALKTEYAGEEGSEDSSFPTGDSRNDRESILDESQNGSPPSRGRR
ncbi:MAG TPA: ligase-associated DNA damage response exonuclease [Burkholderiales bacterium]|nr:ligase-associated DNA damage response exonuclease [Burkholderiales bacterium]